MTANKIVPLTKGGILRHVICGAECYELTRTIVDGEVFGSKDLKPLNGNAEPINFSKISCPKCGEVEYLEAYDFEENK